MKNSILKTTFLLLLISAIYIQGQAQELDPLQLGVKVGLNLSNLYAADATSTDMITGLNLGVFARKPVSEIIDIQPELYISTKGASITYNSLLVDGTAKFNLTYIEMPILCVIKISHFIHLEAGPYVSYLIDGKVKNMANVNLFNFEQNINVNDFNRIDAGFIVGVGAEVHQITMGVSYNYGLTKVGKENTFLGTTYYIPNATNGVINFYISVPIL